MTRAVAHEASLDANAHVEAAILNHVVKRAQGGSDFDLDQLVALCRWCHDQTDAPYLRGRLVVLALGDGQFRFDVIRRNSERECPSHDPHDRFG